MRTTNCKSVIVSHQEIATNIFLMQARWDDAEHIPQAGQFFMLRCWRYDEGPVLSRPISVYEWDAERKIVSFLYEVRGEGTQKFAKQKVGDEIQLTGPMGNGWPVEELLGKKVALVGGGIGTAPFYELAKELSKAGTKPDYFAGFRQEVYGIEEMKPFCNQTAVATNEGTYGHKGLVTELFDAADYDVICCCGPTPMMKAVTTLAIKSGTEIFVSLENKMACGIGACLGCTCHTKTQGAVSVCLQGPVLKGADVYG